MNSQSPYLKIKNADNNRKSSPTKDDSGFEEEDFEEHKPLDPGRTPNFKEINTANKMNNA